MFSRVFLLPLRLNRSSSTVDRVRNIVFTTPASRFIAASFHTSDRLSYKHSDKSDATGRKPANKPEKELLLRQNDPDVFGTLSEMEPFDGKQTTEEEDLAALTPEDAAEQELITNQPLRSQRLTVKAYADLIKGHFKNHQVKEAIDVLEVKMLKEDRKKPNDYLFNLVISGCAKLGYAKKAFQLYNRMKERNLEVTGATYTALFNACAESPFPEQALEQAHNLRKIMLKIGYIPNETNYNAMIKAFGRCGDITTAFQLVDEMKDGKLQLKLDTFNFLLQACASDKELGFRHALLVWHKIYKQRLTPNNYSFGLLLRCTRDCGIGDVNTMRHVMLTILSEAKVKKPKLAIERGGEVVGIYPAAVDPEKAARSGEQSSQLQLESAEQAEENVETTTELAERAPVVEEVCDQTPNLISRTPHLGSLVALSTVKTASDRLLLLGGISGFLKEMENCGVKPDVKLYTTLLEVIPATRAAENKLIQAMRSDGVMTDVDFFNILMKKRAMRFDYEAANVIYSQNPR